MIAPVDKEIKKITYKGSKKSLFVNLLLVVLIAVISGITIGMWILSKDGSGDLYNVDSSALYDNVAVIREESLTKTPVEMGATKCAVLAIDTTYNASNVQMVGVGKVVSMGVTQKINTKTIKQNNKFFYENVSVSSLVSATNRFYLENDIITRIKGVIPAIGGVEHVGITEISRGHAVVELYGSVKFAVVRHFVGGDGIINASRTPSSCGKHNYYVVFVVLSYAEV